MAERTTFNVQLRAAERCAGSQRHHIDGDGGSEVEFTECGLKHATFRAAWNKAGRLLRRDASGRCVEDDAELVRIVGLDDTHKACAEAERRDNGVGHLGCPTKSKNVVPGPGARQYGAAGAAIRKHGGDVLGSELRHLVDTERK